MIVAKTETTNVQRDYKKERENFCWVFIGTNGTGKTSTAKDLILSWKEARPDDLVITFDPSGAFNDVSDAFIQPDLDKKGDYSWAKECNEYRNYLLVLDDYRIIHDSDKMNPYFLNLLINRKNYNIDIIITIHTPSLILTNLPTFTTHYFIFYTQTVKATFEKKMNNYFLCSAASNYVNKYVKIYGKGKYPNFPYIVVDNERGTLTAINMVNSNIVKQI